MKNNSVERSLVKIFGVSLFVYAIGRLSQAVYATIATGAGTASVFFLGILPTMIPLFAGIILFVNPGLLLKGSRQEGFDTVKFDTSQFEIMAISLLGLYLLIEATLTLVYDIALGVMRFHNGGGFFVDHVSAANTVSSIVELAFGYGLVRGARKIRDKLTDYRR